jgi:hypothetical protein
MNRKKELGSCLSRIKQTHGLQVLNYNIISLLELVTSINSILISAINHGQVCKGNNQTIKVEKDYK